MELGNKAGLEIIMSICQIEKPRFRKVNKVDQICQLIANPGLKSSLYKATVRLLLTNTNVHG